MRRVAKASKSATGRDRTDSVGMARRAQEIARMASSAHPPTRQELSQQFGITPRACSHLLEYAKQIGYDFVTARRSDGKLAYQLKGGAMLDRPMTVAEAIASLTLFEAVMGTPLVADRKATEETAHRLKGAIKKDVDEQLARLKGRFAVRMLKAAKPASDAIFGTVLEGILHNRVLAVDYESTARKQAGAVRSPVGSIASGAEGAPTGGAGSARARSISTVEIEPYGVFFAKRSWYLVARKRGAQEMRMYKLARFKRAMPTDAIFEMPRGWTIDTYLKNTWEIVRDPESRLQRVVVDIGRAFASTVEETQWHPSQQTTMLANGDTRFTFEVAGLSEIIYWVLSMGAHATVVSPAELADRIRSEVKAMHARHFPGQ